MKMVWFEGTRVDAEDAATRKLIEEHLLHRVAEHSAILAAISCMPHADEEFNVAYRSLIFDGARIFGDAEFTTKEKATRAAENRLRDTLESDLSNSIRIQK